MLWALWIQLCWKTLERRLVETNLTDAELKCPLTATMIPVNRSLDCEAREPRTSRPPSCFIHPPSTNFQTARLEGISLSSSSFSVVKDSGGERHFFGFGVLQAFSTEVWSLEAMYNC